MPKIPGVNHLDAVKALETAGFRILRQGKHIVMSDGIRILTIPRHNPVNAFTIGMPVYRLSSLRSPFEINAPSNKRLERTRHELALPRRRKHRKDFLSENVLRQTVRLGSCFLRFDYRDLDNSYAPIALVAVIYL